MDYSKITSIALVASVGLASVAAAQPGHDGPDRRPAQQHKQPASQPQLYVKTQPGHPARGAGPDHRFQKGQRLPAEWRHRQYVVNDWRAHRLTQPPRGQQWVQVGSDFVLVAVATGVITSLILNN